MGRIYTALGAITFDSGLKHQYIDIMYLLSFNLILIFRYDHISVLEPTIVV